MSIAFAICASAVADPIKDKLDAIKARGLDYSDAAFFLPFADGKGSFPYVESTVIKERWKNKEKPVCFIFNTQWEKKSRLKDQYCLYFDGKNLSGNSGGGRIFQHNDSHTISAWVAFEDVNGVFTIFCEGHGGIGGRWLQYAWGYIGHDVKVVGDSQSPAARLKYSINPNEWTHLAGVYDREKKVVQLYVNGVMVAENKADIAPINVDASGFYIGAGKVGEGIFKGWMDELLIYNRALSSEQIANIYQKGIPDKGCESIPIAPKLKEGESEFKEKISLDDVWFYADYDKKVEPVFFCGAAGDVQTRKAFPADGPRFDAGRFGDAIRIKSGENAEKADTLSYEMAFPKEQYSLAFWFKPDPAIWNPQDKKPIYNRELFSTLFGTPALKYSSRLQAAGGMNKNRDLDVCEDGKTATDFKQDRWYHVALVSSVTGKTTIYVDGKPTASDSRPYRSFSPILNIGRNWNSKSDKGVRVDGWIDDLVILKSALSDQAVNDLFNSGKPALDGVAGVGFPAFRTVFKRGEKASYPLMLPFKGKVEATLSSKEGKTVQIFSGKAESLSWNLPLDTNLARPGDYKLGVSVSDGKTTQKAETEIRILPSPEPSIPFGLYCVTNNLEKKPDYLEKWRYAGMNYTRVGLGENYSRPHLMDFLYRYGIDYIPNIGTSHLDEKDKIGLKQEDYAQLEVGTDKLSDNCSIFSSIAQERIKARLKNVIGHSSYYPGFKFVSLWDEYDSKHDVSPGAVKYFKGKTGLDKLPDFTQKPKGTVVPDNDPYARWIDTFGVGLWTNKGLAYHDASITEYVKSLNPAIRTMSNPSGGYGGTSVSMPEVYCYLAETDHRKDIGTTELMTESCMEAYRCSDMNRPRKPVWPLLGWWSTPFLPGFNESIKVMTEISLAKGAKGILYAGDTWIFIRDDMVESVRKLAGFRDQYGPFLNTLQYEDLGKVAILWNDYEMMGEKNPAGRPSYAPSEHIAAALRLSGVPYEFMHTDQVLKGELKRFDAVFLPRFDYATESLKKNMDDFDEKGGAVFISEKSSALASQNAIRYNPADFDYRAVQKNDAEHGKMQNVAGLVPKVKELVLAKLKSERPIYADNNYFACYYVPGPGCDVYFIINTDLYLDQTGNVTLANPLANAYSLVDKNPLKTAGKSLPISLKKGEWQVIANYADPIKDLKVTAKREASTVNYSVTLPGKAAVPVTVRFIDPSGKEVDDYRQYVVTGKDGSMSGTLTLAALNDPKGEWKIIAEIPFAGMKTETKLDVK
jgi:hypothetical protein